MQQDPRDKLGAVRMVAFGVLEYEPPTPLQITFHRTLGKDDARTHAAQEVVGTVRAEFEALGWKFALQARNRNNREFILLGPLFSGNAFKTREKIGEGTLQEVCKAALEFIDREAPCPDDTGVF